MSQYREKIAKLFTQTCFPHNSKHCLHDLFNGKQIVLYGAGDGFVTFSMFILKKFGIKVRAVIDRKFNDEKYYCGIPAYSPTGNRKIPCDMKNTLVVITIGKTEYYPDIYDYLTSAGFQHIIRATDIYEYHLHYTPNEIEERGFQYFADHKNKIFRCLELLSDEVSREVFVACLRTYMQRKPISIPCRPLEEQYFPRDISLRKGYSRTINCGAYDGDTIRKLNKEAGKIAALACFEPDKENFQLLSNYLEKRPENIADNICVFPCGVYSSEKPLYFDGGNLFSSNLSKKGDDMIPCVSIDHALPGFKPTFINMDIEGAEIEALKGAEKTITRNKPDLAVCVYHSVNHIWDIPLYLDGLGLDYKYFLRNYTSFISETVLYATS